MDLATLRTTHRKQPFRPIALHTASGRTHRVLHPENMMILRGDQAVAVSEAEGDFDILALALITGISPLDPVVPAAEVEATE